jgi:hypothetical protein
MEIYLVMATYMNGDQEVTRVESVWEDYMEAHHHAANMRAQYPNETYDVDDKFLNRR